ncbi:hypothetical protein [Nesterenkonia suensis]
MAWAQRAEREQAPSVSRPSPQELHRRRMRRQQAERRREEVLLQVLTGPRQH